MAAQRPAPIAESILPYLDAYRKVLHVPASMATIDKLPTRGTTLQAAAGSGIGLDIAGCSSTELAYVYSHASAAGGDLMALYFVKGFTDAERNTPVLSPGGQEYFEWPDVLEKIDVQFDEKLVLGVPYNDGTDPGTTTVPRPFIKRWLRLGKPGNWPVVVRLYVSDTPWPAGRFVAERPHPEEIVWDYAGNSGRIVCLHKKTTLPPRPNIYKTFAGSTAGSITNPSDTPQVFPETNFTDWSEFVYSVKQEFVQGLWVLEEKRMPPPPIRKRLVLRTD